MTVTIELSLGARHVLWIQAADGGWDAWVRPHTGGELVERLELDALSFSGVCNHISRLFDHPEVL